MSYNSSFHVKHLQELLKILLRARMYLYAPKPCCSPQKVVFDSSNVLNHVQVYKNSWLIL